MKNDCYDQLLQKAIDLIDEIKEPEKKISSIISLLPYISNSNVTNKNKSTKKSISKEKIVEETPAETPVEVENDSKVEKPQEDIENVINQQEVQEIAQEVETENIVIPLPEEEEKIEDPAKRCEAIAKRHEAIIKVYGDKKLKEWFTNENIGKYLVNELEAIKQFKNVIKEHFAGVDDSINEEELLHYYMKETTGQQDYTEITISDFLTKFFPYMRNLYVVYYNYSEDQIIKGMKDLTCGLYKTEGSRNINCDNIVALLELLASDEVA